jgi:hypothetical protein
MVSISDWFKDNGYDIDTYDNMGGSGWARMYQYKAKVHPCAYGGSGTRRCSADKAAQSAADTPSA